MNYVWQWLRILIILEGLRQEDCHKFKDSLGYILYSRSAWTTWCLKNENVYLAFPIFIHFLYLKCLPQLPSLGYNIFRVKVTNCSGLPCTEISPRRWVFLCYTGTADPLTEDWNGHWIETRGEFSHITFDCELKAWITQSDSWKK